MVIITYFKPHNLTSLFAANAPSHEFCSFFVCVLVSDWRPELLTWNLKYTAWYFQTPPLFTANNFLPLLYTGDATFQALRQIWPDASNETCRNELSLNLERTASEKGFVISDNQGEGNCMFFALSDQLNLVKGIEMSHSQIRQTVVNYLTNNPTLVR